MAPDSSFVHALAEPRSVNVQSIEQELENLWRGAGREDLSVTRATAFNLIYIVGKGTTDENPSALLAELTLAHPARALLVLLDDASALKGATAWVTAYCHRPLPGAQQICSEFITLDAGSRDSIGIASIIRALLLGGLPATLIWHPSLTLAHPLLLQLAASVNRIIICESEETSPASELSRLFELRHKVPAHVAVFDLLWSRLSPWRNAVAALFDSDENSAQDIVAVALKFSGARIPCGALLTAAWIAVSLDWRTPRITLKGRTHTLTFPDAHTVRLEGTDILDYPGEHPGLLSEIEFVLSSGRRLSIHRGEHELTALDDRGSRQSFPYPDPLLRVLGRELSVWSRHPRRDDSLRAAYEWQKEMLFS